MERPVKQLEYFIKDAIYRLIGFLLKKGRPERLPIDPAKVKHVLFMRYDKIGDMVVSLPVFDTLKERFPDIKISVLCSPGNLPIIKDDPRFEKVFLYRKNIFKDFKELKRMRREKFDCTIDMVKGDSTSAVFLAQFVVRDGIKIGLQKKKFREYYDFSHWDESLELKHILFHTLVVLKPFGILPEEGLTRAKPYVSAESGRRASEFIGSLIRDRSPEPFLVGVNISVGKASRVWPKEKFVGLLKRIDSESGNSVQPIILAAPSDRNLAKQILADSPESVALVPPGLSVLDVSAIIAKLNLVISPDTSIIHIARMYDLPVVGLYTSGSLNFPQWHPFDFIHGSIVSPYEDDLTGISVEEVFEKFRTVMSEAKKAGREAS